MQMRLTPGRLPWWIIPVASLVAGAALMVPGVVLAGQPHLGQIVGSALQAGLLVALLWVCRGNIGPRFQPFRRGVLWAVGCTIAVALAVAAIERISPDVQSNSAEVLQAMGVGQSALADWALVLTICALAPISEELLYRGIILKCVYDLSCKLGLGRGAAAVLALLVSSVSFALAHAGEGHSVSTLATLGLLGATLGGLFLWTGQLWVAVLGHVLNNCIAMAQVAWGGDVQLSQAPALAIVVMPLVALAIMAAVHRPMKKRPH